MVSGLPESLHLCLSLLSVTETVIEALVIRDHAENRVIGKLLGDRFQANVSSPSIRVRLIGTSYSCIWVIENRVSVRPLTVENWYASKASILLAQVVRNETRISL